MHIPTEASLLLLIALLAGLLGIVTLRSVGRVFRIRSTTDKRSESTADGPHGSDATRLEAKLVELLERAFPPYVRRYMERMGASESDVTQALQRALTVAPESVSPVAEVALVATELQRQLQATKDRTLAMEQTIKDLGTQLELMTRRMLSPERVTVIASGMAVGIVLLLCAFGSLLVAIINVASTHPSAVATGPQALTYSTLPPTAPGSYCVSKGAAGVLIMHPSGSRKC